MSGGEPVSVTFASATVVSAGTVVSAPASVVIDVSIEGVVSGSLAVSTEAESTIVALSGALVVPPSSPEQPSSDTHTSHFFIPPL